MDNDNARTFTDDILFAPAAITTEQIILDCATIYAAQSNWIAAYAALPTTINPAPIFYSVPGWQFYLEDLQVNYYAASLPIAPPPDVKANSSQSEIMNAVRAIARDYKKFELSLLRRKSPSLPWSLIAIENLHNYGGIFNHAPLKNPFLSQGEVAIYGKTSQIAIKFRAQDLSRKIEMPTVADTITISGSWRSILSL
jgi:hypothetical protein